LATAELVQLTVEFRTTDMFIFHLKINVSQKFIEERRPRYTRTRPVLHKAENEAEAKTYEAKAEATKFGLEAVLASRT